MPSKDPLLRPDIVGFPNKCVACVGPISRNSGRKCIKLMTITGKTYCIDSLHMNLSWSFYKTVHQK